MAARAPGLAAIDQVRGLSDKARCDPPNKTFRDLPLHVGSLTLPSSALDGRPRTSPPKLRRQPLQLSHRQSISMRPLRPSPISPCSETPWVDCSELVRPPESVCACTSAVIGPVVDRISWNRSARQGVLRLGIGRCDGRKNSCVSIRSFL